MKNYLSEDAEILDFFGVKPLLSTSIRVTKKCNLRCKHCYAEGGNQIANEISFAEIITVMDQLSEMGVSDVFFTGGEPFIRADMPDILVHSNKCGFNTLVSTNGHFVNSELIERIKGIKFKMLQVSIDGTREIHIQNRGKQSMEDALNALELFAKAKIDNVTVGSVLLKNAASLDEMIDFCKEKQIPLFALMLLIEAGRAENMNGPSPEMMHDILGRVFEKYEKHEQAVEFSSNTTLPPALVPFSSRQNNVHNKFACCSFPYILGIEANGDVAPCDGFFPYPEMIVGNVREKPLQEIWENSPLLNEIRQINTSDLKGVCSKCIYLEYCAGGCRAAAYNKYKDLTMPDPACQNYYDAGLFPKDVIRR